MQNYPASRVLYENLIQNGAGSQSVLRDYARTLDAMGALQAANAQREKASSSAIPNRPRGTPVKLPSSHPETRSEDALASEPTRAVARGPYWNHIINEYDSTVGEVYTRYDNDNTVTVLEPHKDYVVTIDLSGIPYDKTAVPLRYTLPPATVQEIKLFPVVITDPRFIQPDKATHGPITIAPRKIEQFRRNVEGGHFQPDPDPLKSISTDMAAGRDPDIRFGTYPFKIHTRSAGQTAIGVSFWHADRPVDEISFSICIREKTRPDTCSSDTPSPITLANPAVFEDDSATPSTVPAAALHIIELKDHSVVAVFHRSLTNNPSATGPSLPLLTDYVSWKVSTDARGFAEKLYGYQKKITIPDHSDDIKDNAAYLDLGRSLVGAIFFDEPMLSPDETDKRLSARTALQQLLAAHRGKGPAVFDPSSTARIVIRVIGDDFTQPFLYPLGLLHLPDDEDPSAFVGYHFAIEVPLPWQSNEHQTPCLRTWVPVLPPLGLQADESGALGTAITHLATQSRIRDDYPTNENPSGRRALMVKKTYSAVTNESDFRRWLASPSADGVIVAILSHHDEHLLYFDMNKQVKLLDSSWMRPGKKFGSPSLVILDGCNTIGAGANAVAGKFNEQGADAIIATNTTIDGEAAAHFLDCFVREIETSKQSITVGEAFYRAQKCLYERLTSHKARALSFSLIGNPSLQICPVQ